MIRPLRQVHRHTVMVLGVFLPVAFALGLAMRQPVPAMASLPAGLAAASPDFPVTEWERADLFAKSPVRVRLCRQQATSGRFAVQLTAATDFVKPDLLVYWIAGTPTPAGMLPADARLLGIMGTSAFLPLPDTIPAQTGSLVLYSLADNELVEVSQPLEIPPR